MNHAARLERLIAGLERPILISNLTNIRYLTGFTGTAAYLYATADGCTFLTDGRYGEVAVGLVAGLPGTEVTVSTSGMLDPIAATLEKSRLGYRSWTSPFSGVVSQNHRNVRCWSVSRNASSSADRS